MAALRAKYSRPREQLIAEANAKGFDKQEVKAPFGQSDALADIIMCQGCAAMGTVKKQYGYRVIDEQCETCQGEGVVRKGLAKKASDELKEKVRKVEALVEAAEDLETLERLEEALNKKTMEALDKVLGETPAAATPAVEEVVAAPADGLEGHHVV